MDPEKQLNKAIRKPINTTTHKRLSNRVSTSSCVGNDTNPRSKSALPSVDEPLRSSPRIGRACERRFGETNRKKHFTKLMRIDAETSSASFDLWYHVAGVQTVESGNKCCWYWPHMEQTPRKEYDRKQQLVQRCGRKFQYSVGRGNSKSRQVISQTREAHVRNCIVVGTSAQLISPALFRNRKENVTETYDRDVDPEEYVAEEPGRCLPWERQWMGRELSADGGELEEPLGSLETTEAFATTDVENASSEMKKRGSEFHGRQEVGSSSKISKRILSSGWSGCVRRLANHVIPCFHWFQSTQARVELLFRSRLVVKAFLPCSPVDMLLWQQIPIIVSVYCLCEVLCTFPWRIFCDRPITNSEGCGFSVHVTKLWFFVKLGS